jgi:hypothetical protein
MPSYERAIVFTAQNFSERPHPGPRSGTTLPVVTLVTLVPAGMHNLRYRYTPLPKDYKTVMHSERDDPDATCATSPPGAKAEQKRG